MHSVVAIVLAVIVGEVDGLIRVSYFNDTATVTKWIISKNRMI